MKACVRRTVVAERWPLHGYEIGAFAVVLCWYECCMCKCGPKSGDRGGVVQGASNLNSSSRESSNMEEQCSPSDPLYPWTLPNHLTSHLLIPIPTHPLISVRLDIYQYTAVLMLFPFPVVEPEEARGVIAMRNLELGALPDLEVRDKRKFVGLGEGVGWECGRV
ncbi:hypothetical protein BCR34DRAFT_341142 [Clohesyomyces aquaticus]|uniref:Uncharacterized protein n=1 Tax=Clohesyomyces aquaticus TaxID=1231657 RepID=A0A1Y2A705_9PLEO|nr:hypothetical protein BCR34DRAFT_341142 [Clohesyomyces aquaticus]